MKHFFITLVLPTPRLERGCVRSTSRSALRNAEASGVFQQPGLAKLLRLVFDTAALLAGFAFVSSIYAQYSIDKFTIAGGGGTSTGGVYAVSGTIGQPDASGPLSGGPYTLVGGFWALPSAVQTPGAPLLSVEQLAGNNVRVFWPLPATGFVLDGTISLVSPPATNAWSQVPFPYQTNATHISITAPPSGNKFYRLRNP